VSFRKVSLGAERASRRVVLSGVVEGDTVVLAPPTAWRTGTASE
jgi:hypothetical protein